jgi:hypothetical protein
MLRSISTFDLLSIKQMNQTERFPLSINSSAMTKLTNNLQLLQTSSSTNPYDIPRTVPVPTVNFLDFTSSSINISNDNYSGKRDVLATKDILSSLIIIDGPATHALNCSAQRMSKRRSITNCCRNYDENTTCDISPTAKRVRLNDRSTKYIGIASHQRECNTPLLKDWTSVYSCLVTSVQNDDNNNDDAFPLIECNFDDVDTVDVGLE